MNVVREINKINERELDLGATGSWHDDYKDSAYIFIGGLQSELTEGDVITIFSQYGEVMDVNLPRDKNTGKTRGFGFLMYEDQRSTILAVDNLNGAKVLERTLRVDHVKNYKQPKAKGEDGEMVEAEEQSLNAKPEMVVDDDAASESSASSGPKIDPEDPMRDYLLAKRNEEKAKKVKKSKGKSKHNDETPEERRARKERKREKKAKRLGKSDGVKGVEELLNELEGRTKSSSARVRHHSASSPTDRSKGGNAPHRRRDDDDADRRWHVSREEPRYRSRTRSLDTPSAHRRSHSPDRRPSRNRQENREDSRKSRPYERDTSPRRKMDYD